MTSSELPPAYAKVREELIEEGFNEQMDSKEAVRGALRGLLLQAEALERQYLNLLESLNVSDDDEFP
jgi:hypothetical protein